MQKRQFEIGQEVNFDSPAGVIPAKITNKAGLGPVGAKEFDDYVYALELPTMLNEDGNPGKTRAPSACLSPRRMYDEEVIDRDRLSYSLMLPACMYVIYYDMPNTHVSLLPIALCATRDEAKELCRTMTDDEIREQVNNRLEVIENIEATRKVDEHIENLLKGAKHGN